jgi:hypothetical protein
MDKFLRIVNTRASIGILAVPVLILIRMPHPYTFGDYAANIRNGAVRRVPDELKGLCQGLDGAGKPGP